MIRIITISICFLFFTNIDAQQSIWKDIVEQNITPKSNSERLIIPNQYRTLELNIENLKSELKKTPLEHTTDARNNPTLLDIPMPNGELETFAIWESPVMAPGLAARFDYMKTYAGKSLSNPSILIRMGYTQKGYHATIHTEEGSVYIDPYAHGDSRYYISYYTKNHQDRVRAESFKCALHPEEELEYLAKVSDKIKAYRHNHAAEKNSSIVQLRNYRLALSSTAEYAAFHGGTVASVMAEYVTVVNRMNSVMNRELAIHFTLVEDNDQLIFFDTSTDGYTHGNVPQLLSQNPGVINAIINPNDYDLGHALGVATAGGTVGLARLGSICTIDKARGVSTIFNPIGDNFYIDILCHEVGHQLGGPHTFNLCDNDNENVGTGFEPGSGSTIMSYAGSCGANNIQFNADDYYNIGALELMKMNIETDDGNTCPTYTDIGNNTPVANIEMENGFYIPINTPFELEGIATDEDGDNVRYCWEQYDLGPLSLLTEPMGNAPIVRSFDPVTSSTRVVPRIPSLVSNSTVTGERLPNYTRDMTFRMVVRDYNAEGGATDWDEVKFKVTDTAGPFRVNYPSAGNIEMEVGEYIEVEWREGNTAGGLVNSPFVDIFLSTNGGSTFPILLAENVPNDSSTFIVVPDNVTNTARIKIKSSNNIFFDISNANFKILPPSEPGFAWTTSPNNQQACLPNNVEVELSTTSLLDYTEAINFEVIEGLPAGALANFTNNPATPGENAMLSIDLSGVEVEDVYDITVQAISALDTTYRTVTFTTVNNDFSAVELSGPLDGASGLSTLPTFDWSFSDNANSYTIEIATNPAFGNSIVDQQEGLTTAAYTPNVTLDENTLYYWRVIPVNECGAGTPTNIAAFHTVSVTCLSDNSEDTPIAIPASGAPVLESKLNILSSGIISDINIPIMKGNHQWMSDLTVKLISPVGTTVTLFTNKCLNYNGQFNFGLDDQAPAEFACPPVGGSSFLPNQSLSAFIGENTAGTWTLEISDVNGGNGGSIDDWSIEFCANVSLDAPYLVSNKPMPVNPQAGRPINQDFLKVKDDNNSSSQLIYTLVTVPSKGQLDLESDLLEVGSEFTQSDINQLKVNYLHTGSLDDTADDFTFTVRDGQGGWVGIYQFDIVIDPNITVGIEDALLETGMNVYPNPTEDYIIIEFEKEIPANAHLELLDVQGRLLLEQKLAPSQKKVQLNLNTIPSGVYLLKVESEGKIYNQKVTIQ